ncbi:hypothetical protein GW17_00062209 [Ensete ventricosum]|nr:hypothetical protein GW17_00062209 [Ensete ventricosum]
MFTLVDGGSTKTTLKWLWVEAGERNNCPESLNRVFRSIQFVDLTTPPNRTTRADSKDLTNERTRTHSNKLSYYCTDLLVAKSQTAQQAVCINAAHVVFFSSTPISDPGLGCLQLKKKKTMQLLRELGLPSGLLPLEDIEEVGYNHDDGFVWLTQKKKKNHMFEEIKQLVSYAAEVTAFVEDRKLKKITGVKARELLLWFTVVEVYVDDHSSGKKITFRTATGLSETFPESAFEIDLHD